VYVILYVYIFIPYVFICINNIYYIYINIHGKQIYAILAILLLKEYV